MEKLLLSIKDVQGILSIGKTTIYKMVKDEKFPKPIKVNGRSLWRKSDIENWVKNLDKNV